MEVHVWKSWDPTAVCVWKGSVVLSAKLKADVEVTLAEMEEHVMTITTLTPVLV